MKIIWIAVFLTALLGTPFLLQAENPAPDFSKIADVKQKKQLFFDYLTPYVHVANQEILEERRYVESLDFNNLSKRDRNKVKQLVKKYRLKYKNITLQTQKTLLKKIDIIPPSLALAQAANESSWGTSRFATQGNNFFGQWCFTKGCGLVPLRRPQGKYHEVKKFDSPLASIKSYMLMLNNHPAFKSLRDSRLKSRRQNKAPTGLALVQGLEPYSALKQQYVDIIASMIRTNKLLNRDKAALHFDS
ncbi:MAG: glucosaminidase domain-containing protein [Thiomicrorhabdus chilensis]|uniref:glucosaminidase domain-containing protein n=1 Tax=Thiomicrorhabdus chilensis TaxID=63656 RepID=UPI00299D44B9|nr:glucosaminidase domain-containing protein [Thiomicrorhabdus chilensis]MDX1348423.1 glucosaminidase domain-containing protein [Thiomicrorhabdus chilensis]